MDMLKNCQFKVAISATIQIRVCKATGDMNSHELGFTQKYTSMLPFQSI